MRNILLILLLFLFHDSAFAQQKQKNITIQFDNVKIEKVLIQIEELTDYKFYFISNWFDKTPLVSGEFTKTSIENLLDDLFKGSVLNYHIRDNQVVLTQNSLVYDYLPKSFFGSNNSTSKQIITNPNSNKTPFFYSKNEQKVGAKIDVIKIGKENKLIQQTNYKLSGFVINKSTNKPIANMVLQFNNKNIITDEKGFYSTNLPAGMYWVKTKLLGIKDVTKKVFLYNDGVLNFNLSESIEFLDAIIVNTTLEKNIKDENTGVEKIDVEEIKNIPLVLGERDILKVATTLPGISKAGEGVEGFNVRGGKVDQNLILLDDAIVYNSSHFFGIFSALNPFTTGDVKIYKGSMPVEYGGRLSSVFDIKTKIANKKQFKGEGAIGPVTANLMIDLPVVKEKSGLIAGGRATYANWILKSLNEESLKNSNASFYDFILSYDHTLNKNNTLKVMGYYSKDKYSITSDSLQSYSNRLMSIKWNHIFNKKNKLKLVLANSQYKYGLEFDGNTNRDFKLGYQINEINLKLNATYRLNKKHKFNYGISAKHYSVQPGLIEPLNSESIITTLNISKEKALENAIFVSDKIKLNKKITVNAGIRYSFFSALGERSQRVYANNLPKSEETVLEIKNFSNNESIKTYNGAEFRLSARYLLTPTSSIKLSYDNTYQYIHRLSNNTTASPTDTWKLSDLNIKPQQGTQYSLGVYKNLKNNIFELSLEGYYKTSKNILDYKTGASLLLNENLETEVLQGLGKSYGIEFLAKKQGRLNGWISYTYSRSLIKLDSDFEIEKVNNGKYFSSNYDKPHNFNLVGNYKATKRYSFSINATYQTGRPVTYPVGKYTFGGIEYVSYSNRNEFRIPDYYRLDLGINIEGNHKIKKIAHSFWNISVYNVLGRNNPYSVFFVSDNGQIKAYKISIFSIPVPTITYNFKF